MDSFPSGNIICSEIKYKGFFRFIYILTANKKIIHRKCKIIHTSLLYKNFPCFIIILEYKIIHTKDKIISIHFCADYIIYRA